MRVVFLGCGYLGSNLYSLLKEQFECEMWGIDSPYRTHVDDMKFVNVFDPEEMRTMDLQGAVVVDTVALVASTAKTGDEEAALNDVVKKYQELLGVLKEGGVERFVYFSSGGTIYGSSEKPMREDHPLDPRSLYAKSKDVTERVIRASGVPYLILRLSNPYGGYQLSGKRQGVIPVLITKALLHEEFEMWGEGDSVRDYIYITDLATAIAGLLKNVHEDATVNVGSGLGVSLDEVIALVEKTCGEKLWICRKTSDVPQVKNIVLNVEKLQNITGVKPIVEIEAGIGLETERIRKELGI